MFPGHWLLFFQRTWEGLIPSPHMLAHNKSTPIPGNPTPSFDLLGHQVNTW